MKYQYASEWVNAYDTIHQELTVKVSNDVEYQLVRPHCHRRNAAERAIRTFKDHFVAGLSSLDPIFPLHLWDRRLPQADSH
jgi:hypothetical protein